jgi:hypothetical protein
LPTGLSFVSPTRTNSQTRSPSYALIAKLSECTLCAVAAFTAFSLLLSWSRLAVTLG